MAGSGSAAPLSFGVLVWLRRALQPPFYFSINLRPPALTYFKIKKIKHENINGFFKFIWY